MLKRFIRKYIFATYHVLSGRLIGWHIFQFHVDLRVFLFEKEEFAQLGLEAGWTPVYPEQYKGVSESGFFLEIPRWFVHLTAFRHWALRKPLGYIFLGWLIRAIIAA